MSPIVPTIIVTSNKQEINYMPKKKNPGIPEEFPKKPEPPEVDPHSVPEQTPLPGEAPVHIPQEAPEPEIPEQPGITPGTNG